MQLQVSLWKLYFPFKLRTNFNGLLKNLEFKVHDNIPFISPLSSRDSKCRLRSSLACAPWRGWSPPRPGGRRPALVTWHRAVSRASVIQELLTVMLCYYSNTKLCFRNRNINYPDIWVYKMFTAGGAADIVWLRCLRLWVVKTLWLLSLSSQ